MLTPIADVLVGQVKGGGDCYTPSSMVRKDKEPVLSENEDTREGLRSSLLWIVPGRPVNERFLRGLLRLRGNGHRFDADVVFDDLEEDGILQWDPDYRTVRVVNRRLLRGFLEPSPDALEQQRRAVRNVWLKAIKDQRHHEALRWLLPHLLLYYRRLTSCDLNYTRRKPDFDLRLYTIGLCAALNDLEHAREHQAALSCEQALSPGSWSTQHASHEQYVSALIAIRERNWAQARVHLRSGFDLWLESGSRLHPKDASVVFRDQLEAMRQKDLREALEEPWDEWFRGCSMEHVLSQAVDDLSAQFGSIAQTEIGSLLDDPFSQGDTSSPKRLPIPSMTAEEIASYLCTRLQHPSYLEVLGYVVNEGLQMRLPGLVDWPNVRCARGPIGEWFKLRFTETQTGTGAYSVDVAELRSAIRFLGTHYAYLQREPDIVGVRSTMGPLPYLELQVGNAVAHVPGVLTGVLPWETAVSFEDFSLCLRSLRYPVQVSSEGAYGQLVVKRRSRSLTLDPLAPNMRRITRVTFPTQDELLARIEDSLEDIRSWVSAQVHQIAWQFPRDDFVMGDEARRNMELYLATSCHLLIQTTTTPEQGILELSVGDQTWQKRATVRHNIEGSIAIDSLLWLSNSALGKKPYLCLTPRGDLAIVNRRWSQVIVTPLI